MLRKIGSYPKSVDSVLERKEYYGGKEYQKRCILRQDWKSGSNGGESGKSMEETDWLDSVCMTMPESVTDRLAWGCLREHTYIHPFNRPFYGTTQVSRYQKGKTNLDFTEARDSEWQWHQLGHMQVCTSLHRQMTTPAPHHSVFSTSRMLFLPPNQHWCDSTQSQWTSKIHCLTYYTSSSNTTHGERLNSLFKTFFYLFPCIFKRF